MKVSSLLTNFTTQGSSSKVADGHHFLVKAGYISKYQGGRYSFLPLGMLVLNNLTNLIRDEMVRAGGQETRIPLFHSVESPKQRLSPCRLTFQSLAQTSL